MVSSQNEAHTVELAAIAARARAAYARCLAGSGEAIPWWTAVIITASSARQAARYLDEIRRRRENGTVPAHVRYLVVPDLDDERIGSGGATLNALRALAEELLAGTPVTTLDAWWATQRVLIIHSGGDSRRLPQYSLSGKLFSALPVKTPWGGVSSVFDEMLALSTAWAERLTSGLVVASGDVILTFDAGALHWDRPGVSGVAMREPNAVGSKHGVYVVGDQGRVYAFLQKPSAIQVREAGGMLADEMVALDTGLLYFDRATAARLTALAGVVDTGDAWAFGRGLLTRTAGALPTIDLYEHMTLALTGQWAPAEQDAPVWHQLAAALRHVPFWCDLVDGEFTHIGTTTLFRQLMTEETNFSRLYESQQRLGAVTPPGVRSAGVIIDSVLADGGELGAGSVTIECHFTGPVQAEVGAILHGLTDIPGTVRVPADTVAHQVPIMLEDGRRGVVIRIYAVTDDPKGQVTNATATWLTRPLLEILTELGLDLEEVWRGVPVSDRTLWNARLFPLGTPADAWACARWLFGDATAYTADDWGRATKLSLADSARWADIQALAAAQTRRLDVGWQMTAVSLAKAGSDIRPLLAMPPSVRALAAVGHALSAYAADLERTATLTDAASQYYQAGSFLAQAGLAQEAEETRAHAFHCVQQAVTAGMTHHAAQAASAWRHNTVTVAAPARVDLGGGWSDTPPFCLDWGGTVLNVAIAPNGVYPISTTIRRLDAPVIRCLSADSDDQEEYRTTAEVLATPGPGCPFSIPRIAVRMCNFLAPDVSLADALTAMGGGLEIRTAVELPMGSGLGTSSILAATVLQALAVLQGKPLPNDLLSDQVMYLEQMLTTGGGWQDQAGGIFPGAKLLLTGPGPRQHIRVQPVAWSPERQQEFTDRFVLYYTGIRRVAKNLLAQVVGSYLAREVAPVQVLHSIKTLAVEMAYAMAEGEWAYLGSLLDRHWSLNQILDPHTTNTPINALLDAARPYLAGAKLAGAGGGGFLMLLATDPQAAIALKARLSQGDLPGAVYAYTIAEEDLRVTVA